jgi:putative ABC transport system ATP-binding protein
MTPPLIELKHVSRVYGSGEAETAALDNVSFIVPEGQFVSIIGPSGSGKSTLLHLLGLLDTPTSGTYLLRGIDTVTINEKAKAALRNTTIGFIFQTFHLLPRTSVLANVMLPLQYTHLSHHQQIERARAAVEQVQMGHRLHHTPAELSGGEKQRTVIARALVNQPKILLADEPTGNLDSTTGQVIMKLLNNLHQQGLTILVITHETPTARFAERIISVHDGQIVSDESQTHKHTAYEK